MKKTLHITFYLFLSISSFGQKLNFEAIDRYFSITDSLRQNIPLSDKSWNELLSYKGVELYIKNNALDPQTLKAYKRDLEIAYLPKKDSVLNERLKQIEKYFFVWVFNNYKTQEKELKNYYQKIKANPQMYLDSLYANGYSMLPKKMQKKADNTTIYFIPIMNDAVAEEHDVIFTLYGAYHYDRLKYGALGGHELHHVLRKNKSLDNSEKDKYLYEALTLLLNEGSADLIDKKYTALKECPQDLAYFDYLMEVSPNALAALDTTIMAHIDDVTKISEQDLPNIVPMSGHIPGCYMATIIDRNRFRKELIANIDDPIKFVLLYNKAAKIDKEKPFVFSDKTISYLKKLKQK